MAADASPTRRVRWEVLPTSKAATTAMHKWKVTRDGEVIGMLRTKALAIALAATTARCSWQTQGQLATLKIKGRDGRIQEERTYGRDPSRTKG